MGPDQALDVDTIVLVEAFVLDRDDRALHVLADLAQRHLDPVLIEQGRDAVAVGIEHVRAVGQWRCGQLGRQRADLLGRDVGGLTETGNDRDGHRGHDRAADDAYRRDACDCGQRVTRRRFLGILRHSHQT